jgi:hypothetical protein
LFFYGFLLFLIQRIPLVFLEKSFGALFPGPLSFLSNHSSSVWLLITLNFTRRGVAHVNNPYRTPCGLSHIIKRETAKRFHGPHF